MKTEYDITHHTYGLMYVDFSCVVGLGNNSCKRGDRNTRT